MKILTIHNKYQFRGGEDEVHAAEEQLLRSRGNQVRSLLFDNLGIGGFGAVRTGLRTPWNQASYRLVADEIATCRPDLVNIHNFFPLATPAVHHAARRAGVPVVQTLHNFRTICPNAVLFRKGSPCQECLGKTIPWPGILHACYRDGYAASAAVAAMISVHHILNTWQTQVSLFFALTEFSRQKFIQAGFPAERLVVKPNFVWNDLGPGSGEEDFVFYAGRVSEEKGIRWLLDSWQAAKPRGRLLLAGEGPLVPLVEAVSASDDSVQYLGRLPLEEVYRYMGDARAFVFPSLMYEGGTPRAIIEAFSRGTPVIASRFGSMEEIVRDQETGWLVTRGDCASLAGALGGAFTDRLDHFRSAARAEFERNYTADRQYDLLMLGYLRAMGTSVPSSQAHAGQEQQASAARSGV